MEELNPIEIIKAHVDDNTINEPYPHIKIEPEIVEYARFLMEIIPQRTKKRIEKEKGEMGLIGQELFNGFLLQYKIPNVYGNPLYEDKRMRQWKGKHFDFFIPHMPENKKFISVKTVPEGSRAVRFMANVESWKNEIHDIVVAIKIESKKRYEGYIAGWLDAKVVETLPIGNWDKEHDSYWNAYWTYLDPEFVCHNRESEIPNSASRRLKPLYSTLDLVQELLNGAHRKL